MHLTTTTIDFLFREFLLPLLLLSSFSWYSSITATTVLFKALSLSMLLQLSFPGYFSYHCYYYSLFRAPLLPLHLLSFWEYPPCDRTDTDNDNNRLAAPWPTLSMPPSLADYQLDVADVVQNDFISSLAGNTAQIPVNQPPVNGLACFRNLIHLTLGPPVYYQVT